MNISANITNEQEIKYGERNLLNLYSVRRTTARIQIGGNKETIRRCRSKEWRKIASKCVFFESPILFRLAEVDIQ
jgi:hypothetical protein